MLSTLAVISVDDGLLRISIGTTYPAVSLTRYVDSLKNIVMAVRYSCTYIITIN